MLEGISTVFFQLLPVVVTILTPAVFLVALHFVRKFTANLEIDHRQKIEDFVTTLVGRGVSYAEQYAANKTKENQEVHGNQKLYVATERVLDEARVHGLIDLTKEEVEKRIESFLGTVRIEKEIENSFLEEKGSESENEQDFTS